jgi:hypothetical protein
MFTLKITQGFSIMKGRLIGTYNERNIVNLLKTQIRKQWTAAKPGTKCKETTVIMG